LSDKSLKARQSAKSVIFYFIYFRVCGVGTGLGICFLVPIQTEKGDWKHYSYPTEGGHSGFP